MGAVDLVPLPFPSGKPLKMKNWAFKRRLTGHRVLLTFLQRVISFSPTNSFSISLHSSSSHPKSVSLGGRESSSFPLLGKIFIHPFLWFKSFKLMESLISHVCIYLCSPCLSLVPPFNSSLFHTSPSVFPLFDLLTLLLLFLLLCFLCGISH